MEVSAVEAPRRRSSDSSSPDFEFWMVGNHPSSPDTHLLTADELFVDGVLLPLHLLSLPRPDTDPKPEPEPEPAAPDPPPADLPSASICSPAPSTSGSKRWRDIFKVGEKKAEEKERRKERKGSTGGNAELNINIWPFSRSRSAGNGASGSRPRAAMAGRKASSAPCSRSNSRGESSKPATPAAAAATAPARRWAASPGRAGLSGGVHLGRTSPVWQLRRPTKAAEPAPPRVPDRDVPKDKAGGGGRKFNSSGGGGGARMISLNVNTCIGYRNQVTCRGDDNDGVAAGSARGGESSTGNGSGSLFNLRTLFSKKVY